VAMARYRTYFDTQLKYYPIYLMYTFMTEILGYFIKFHEEFQIVSNNDYDWYNVIIYNIYLTLSYLFFYYIYWKTVKEEKHKKWIRYGAGISLTGYAISLFFQNPFYSDLYYADLLASWVLLFSIWLYLKEKKAEISPYPLRYNLLFWTSAGLAVFQLFFPYLIIIGYEAPNIWITYNFREVLKILILIMYGSFLIGVLIHRRRAFR
jgi:hypothetical protein